MPMARRDFWYLKIWAQLVIPFQIHSQSEHGNVKKSSLGQGNTLKLALAINLHSIFRNPFLI